MIIFQLHFNVFYFILTTLLVGHSHPSPLGAIMSSQLDESPSPIKREMWLSCVIQPGWRSADKSASLVMWSSRVWRVYLRFLVLTSNECHAMLHRGGSWPSWTRFWSCCRGRRTPVCLTGTGSTSASGVWCWWSFPPSSSERWGSFCWFKCVDIPSVSVGLKPTVRRNPPNSFEKTYILRSFAG